MTLEDTNSKWRRDAKTASALRLGDRVSLVLGKKGWMATLPDQVVRPVPAPPTASALEDAIAAADASFPPPGWELCHGRWARKGWKVLPEQTGWYVYRVTADSSELASVQEFPSADRARRWAEVRLDRTGTNLRGPKPRAGHKSTCKLPDVRVTESEKAVAMALLKDLSLTYSQFVRASIRFAELRITRDPADEDDWAVRVVDGKAEFVSVRDMDLAELDSMRADYRSSERREERVPRATAPTAPTAPEDA